MNSQNPKHLLTLGGQPLALVEHLLRARHSVGMWGSSGVQRQGRYKPVLLNVHGQIGSVPVLPRQDQSIGGALLGVSWWAGRLLVLRGAPELPLFPEV